MTTLLILADDLTGALDTGVQIAQQQVNTQVRLYAGPDTLRSAEEAEVLVIDTESRHLPPERAAELVSGLVREAAAQGVPYLYKKTDSVLRGNVGAELMAAAQAAGVRPLPFVPAWPENGRTTRGGIHYVDGVPVAQSSFAADVLDPIRSSRIDEILTSTAPCRSRVVEADSSVWPDDGDVLIFDAQTGGQVDRIAEALCRRGMARLTAGCARLLQSLAPHIAQDLPVRAAAPVCADGPGRILLACGSLSPVSLSQTAYARRQLGYVPVAPDGDPSSGEASQIPSSAHILLRSTRAETGEEVQRYLETIPPSRRAQQARYTAECMARRVQEIADRAAVDTLIIFGGDTLAAVIRRMGIQSLQPVAQPAKGVVLCQVEYRGRSLRLITKSGGFGGENLVEIIQTALTPAPDLSKSSTCKKE